MSGNPLLNMMAGGVGNPIQAMLQNNPFMQVINMAKNGGNPIQMLQQMSGQNPQLKQIMDMTNGKSPSEMGDMINSLAQQKGINVSDLVKQIGMPDDVAKRFGIK